MIEIGVEPILYLKPAIFFAVTGIDKGVRALVPIGVFETTATGYSALRESLGSQTGPKPHINSNIRTYVRA